MNIVILAAGASSRMGAHKLLLEFEGQTLLQRAARRALEVCPNVLVVLGRDAALVQQSLAGLPVRFVVNEQFENGKMETSFQTAIAVLEPQDTIFMLADMPLISSAMLRELVVKSEYTVRPYENFPFIVASRFGQVLAPPHLFRAALLPEVARFGAKPTIVRHLEQTVFCDWAEELLFDVDTPKDWEKLQALSLSELERHKTEAIALTL
jgi:molybdenum cofactor cytidylyltransferase